MLIFLIYKDNNNKNVRSGQEKKGDSKKKHISFCDGRRNQEEQGATIWVAENVP